MEEIIIKRIEDEIKRFEEILEMDNKDNRTLQGYRRNYEIIKEYLENFLIDTKKIINNPTVRKKYEKEIN